MNSQRLKLLIFSHSGVVDVNRVLYQSLGKIPDLDVTLVVPRSWKGDTVRQVRFSTSTEDRHIRVIPAKTVFSGRKSLYFYCLRLRRLLKAFSPDLILLDEEPWSLCALQVYRAFPNVPKIFYTKENLLRKFRFPFSTIQRHVLSRTQLAFAVAQESETFLKAHNRFSGQVHYLPHSVDPSRFHPRNEHERAAVLGGLKISPEKTVFAYFGEMRVEKGVRDLLTAIEAGLALPEFKDVHFLFVGDGPLTREVSRFVRTHGLTCITQVPYILYPRTPRLMASIDVLVLPSRVTSRWRERFCRGLLEAQACKAAVIGSDSGEIPHLLERTRGGLIYPQGNWAELLDRILQLLRSPEARRRLAENGYEAVKEKFTSDVLSASLASELKRLHEQSRR